MIPKDNRWPGLGLHDVAGLAAGEDPGQSVVLSLNTLSTARGAQDDEFCFQDLEAGIVILSLSKDDHGCRKRNRARIGHNEAPMHELSATESMLSLVLDEAAKAGAARVTRISLKIGDWSTFVPDSIEFCFGLISGGTPAQGAALDIQRVPVVYRCSECGIEYTPGIETTGCPGCGGATTSMLRGREFYIDSIEVDGEYSGCTSGS